MLPAANTWMAACLLGRLEAAPPAPVLALLGLMLGLFVLLGLQARAFRRPLLVGGDALALRRGSGGASRQSAAAACAPRRLTPPPTPTPTHSRARPQVRFFLHTPLQLASVLFAATSTPALCGRLWGRTDSLACAASVSALQLALGLALPGALVYVLEGRTGRGFMPHVAVKRPLLHP